MSKSGQKRQILGYLPTPSCPRGYLMPTKANEWQIAMSSVPF